MLSMLLATLIFAVMAGAVKVARAELSAFEVMMWRGLMAAPLLAPFCIKRGFYIHAKGVMALRTLFGFVAMGCFFFALKALPVADFSLINKLQPVLVGIAAPLLLGASEKVGRLAWLGLGFGLVGVAVLVGPQLRVGNLAGLIAAIGTASWTIAHIMLRRLGTTDRPIVLVFWFQLFLAPLGLLGHLVFVGTWPQLPGASLAGPLIVSALAATSGQWLMTIAYKLERATVVAAVSYAGPLWALLVDVLYFHIEPSAAVWVGGAFVALAGYLLVQDNLSRLRREA